MTELRYDPLDPAIHDDPYPLYARLRAEAPVLRAEPHGFHVVSRYDDVVTVLRRPDIFSSKAMQGLAGRARAVTKRPSTNLDATLIGADAPAHTRLRKIVNRGFTPTRIAAWEPRIRQVARGLVRAFAPRGEGDLVADVAVPLPVAIISEILGVPPERSADFKRWSNAVVLISTGNPSEAETAVFGAAMVELFEFLGDQIEQRRRAPKQDATDLISTLVREHEDGALAPQEVMNFALTLLVAGNETTTNLLGNAVLALARNPDVLARAQRDRALVYGLVEETLRWESPIQMTLRVATQDVELGGVTIPAGGVVTPLLGSANRDDARFPDAARFDPSRDASGHVAFGHGTHFCLGAGLARLEARCALEALVPQLHELALCEDKVPRHASMFVRGPTRLRIAWRPRGDAPDAPDSSDERARAAA